MELHLRSERASFNSARRARNERCLAIKCKISTYRVNHLRVAAEGGMKV